MRRGGLRGRDTCMGRGISTIRYGLGIGLEKC